MVQAHNSRYPGSEKSQIGLVGEKERCAYFRVGIVEMVAAALTFAWGALTMGLGIFLVSIEEFLLVAILAALTSAIWMIWLVLNYLRFTMITIQHCSGIILAILTLAPDPSTPDPTVGVGTAERVALI